MDILSYVMGKKAGGGGGDTPTGTIEITQNGVHNVAGYAQANVNVQVEQPEPKDLNFYDYDGTLLYSYYIYELQEMGSLPPNPSHEYEGLTAQGWNWTYEQAVYPGDTTPRDIGQLYTTDDGKTHIHINLAEGRVTPTLGVGLNGTATIDWGDGTEPDTITGTSLTSAVQVQHTYDYWGTYIIKIAVEGTMRIFGTTASSHLLKKSMNGMGQNKIYLYAVERVHLGDNTELGSYAFNELGDLRAVTLPRGISTIGNHAFAACYELPAVVLPPEVTQIDQYAFYYSEMLKTVVTPPSLADGIGMYAFEGCVSLQNIHLPWGVGSLGAAVFKGCRSLHELNVEGVSGDIPASLAENNYNLRKVVLGSSAQIGEKAFLYCSDLTKIEIPGSVTFIGAQAFAYCYGLAHIYIRPETPPTLGGSNAFSGIPSDCVIHVPVGALSSYQNATNWAAYASQMQEG